MIDLRQFDLLKDYRAALEAFSIDYDRAVPAHWSAAVKAAIHGESLRANALVEDPCLTIWDHNYSGM